MILGIYGAGGLGREVLELAGLINARDERWGEFVFIIDGDGGAEVNGVKVYSYGEAIHKFAGNLEVSMGIGEPAAREKIFEKLEKDGIPEATLVHPDVHIPSSTTVGKGVTIQYGCFVSCNVVVEDYVYIQPQANIGHNDCLKKGCLISGMSNLAGNVSIGEFTYIGLSVAIREKVSIGDHSIIGMYSGVYKDIPSEVIAMGNPARPMKSNDVHKVFK